MEATGQKMRDTVAVGKPFEQLTPLGQARRLRVLASEAATNSYGLPSPTVALVSQHSFNTVFRVQSAGDMYALRIGSDCRIHPVGVEDVEAAWLDSLHEHGFETARNVPTIGGERWTTATAPTIPGERVCTLFTWVPGVELRRRNNHRRMHEAGQILARLHQHAARHQPGNTSAPDLLQANRAIYFGDQDRVATYESTHGKLFVEATARVQEFIDGIWATATEPAHLLHGDFGAHNLLHWKDKLRPIDFQDMRYGYPIQDLGIALADLARNNSPLVTHFRQGYQDVATLPDLAPETLVTLSIGRSLNVMNLALLAPKSGIGAALDLHAAKVVDWMHGAR